ncbi:hypothetical protein CC78DRAFT_613215 [Lojkania enalia]|uniref:Uncharacterized protein n=1 Tax=Lojkania enalia TaxID=147567 RepID=A0A9P4N971_9PLEO|nr:hypothetical protein CC78DRAFT_613215 [Didymosphaeria enalia]
MLLILSWFLVPFCLVAQGIHSDIQEPMVVQDSSALTAVSTHSFGSSTMITLPSPSLTATAPDSPTTPPPVRRAESTMSQLPDELIGFTFTFGTYSPWNCPTGTWSTVPAGYGRCCPAGTVADCPMYTTCINGSVIANQDFTTTCTGTNSWQSSCIMGTVYESLMDVNPKVFPSCWPSWTRGDWEATRTPPTTETSSAPPSQAPEDIRGGYLVAVIFCAILGFIVAVEIGVLGARFYRNHHHQGQGPQKAEDGKSVIGLEPVNPGRPPDVEANPPHKQAHKGTNATPAQSQAAGNGDSQSLVPVPNAEALPHLGRQISEVDANPSLANRSPGFNDSSCAPGIVHTGAINAPGPSTPARSNDGPNEGQGGKASPATTPTQAQATTGLGDNGKQPVRNE